MLKAYMIHAGDQQEAAALVFAQSFKKAKALAFSQSVVCDGCEYTDVRGHLIRQPGWLIENAADPAKYDAGIAHVNDTPPSCQVCELWGNELFDGLCEDCADAQEEIDE